MFRKKRVEKSSAKLKKIIVRIRTILSLNPYSMFPFFIPHVLAQLRNFERRWNKTKVASFSNHSSNPPIIIVLFNNMEIVTVLKGDQIISKISV